MSQFDDVFASLTDQMHQHALSHADKDAVICGKTRLSWSALDRALNQVAQALLRSGLQKGDRVAVVMGNCVENLLIMFGAFRAGACAVPLSPLLTADQLRGLLQDADPGFVFASAQTHALATPSRAALGPGCQWVAAGFADDGWTTWEAFLEGAADDRPQVHLRGDDAFCIIYSSGTTGIPKGILHSQRSRYELAYSCAHEMRFDHSSVALTTTSLYSMGTFLMLLPVFLSGGTLIVLEQFSPTVFFDAVQRERVTHTFLVPPQFLMLLADAQLARTDLSSLRCMLSAGSPLRVETKQEILERMGSGLYELYGTSEGVATMMKPEQRAGRMASVGQPMLGHCMRIVDLEGCEVPPGEAGEVVGRSNSLMRGYYNKPAETDAAVWRDATGATWFRTGDIGRMDDRQFVSIVDRKKDMIISGGFNLYPVDIETVLAGHEAVFDVTVIGVPHPKWDETPLALVIRRPGVDTSAEAIQAWANERLAKHQRISAIEFRSEFPRNALGKVLKRELRTEYWTASTAR